VAAWQMANSYPLNFLTEASLDLAEDAELMALMVEANFAHVFVGIESPDEGSLRETKKYQNVRKGDSIVSRVHIIQRVGLEVYCGMIVGFDNDGPGIFAAQREFLREARIGHAMVGMLYAVPKTPLYDRLRREGRLDTADFSEYGTNVIPLRMSRAALRDGYREVMRDLYEPEAFFDRVEDLYLRARIPFYPARRQPALWRRAAQQARWLAESAVLFRRLMRHVRDPALRREYRKRVFRLLKSRPDIGLLHYYLIKCAMHYHYHTMVRQMANGEGPIVNISGMGAALVATP